MMEAAIEAGADDVVLQRGRPRDRRLAWSPFARCRALEAKFGEPARPPSSWRRRTTIAVDDEAGEKILKLIDRLDDNDDVQNVYSNVEILRRAGGQKVGG